MTSELHERFLSKHWSEDQESTSRNWRKECLNEKLCRIGKSSLSPCGVGPSKNTLSLEPSCKRILSTSMDESRAFSSASVFAWLSAASCGSRCPEAGFYLDVLEGHRMLFIFLHLSPSIYPKANSHFASFLIYWPYLTIMLQLHSPFNEK